MYDNGEIAIISMSGRYSKSDSIDELWNSICQSKELNYDSDKVIQDDNYVGRFSMINDIKKFDYKFFGMQKKEASVVDPQQRIFLECCFETLQNAGYADTSKTQAIGVFASSSLSTYMYNNLLGRKELDEYSVLMANDKEFLTSRVAYKLNLSGPAVTIQTACSSSLVALHYACLSLKNNECNMALVGGVSISIPQDNGYFYQEGGIRSKDGYCRPFNEEASGIIKGNGCSVIMIKSLDQAILDNDNILATINGTAVNNDGNNKIGYTAPGLNGHTQVINSCINNANVTIDDIDYIETHGTGTQLGDLIEIEALSKVFKNKKEKIAIGSIKGNIGHLDAAAGITSIIKTVKMLNENKIPAIANLLRVNRKILDPESNIYIPEKLEYKKLNYIGISSLGIGGTNAHVILHKYMQNKSSSNISCRYIIQISSFRKEDMEYIKKDIDASINSDNISDFSYTYAVGKQRLKYVDFLIYNANAEKIDVLIAENISIPQFTIQGLKELRQYIPCFDKYVSKNKNTQESNMKYISALINMFESIGVFKYPNMISKEKIQSQEVLVENAAYSVEKQIEELLIFLGTINNVTAIDWKKLFVNSNCRHTNTPLYPLQKVECWINERNDLTSSEVSGIKQNKSIHQFDDILLTLLSICQEELGVDNMDKDDNFYDLDIDSFVIIQIVDKIQKVLKTKIPITIFMEKDTPMKLALYIKEAKLNQSEKNKNIHIVSKNRNIGKKVFLIHPAGGTTFCYKHLCKSINSKKHVIYAIDLPENYKNYNSMEKLAEFYFQQIKNMVNSNEQIILGGYSFGGNLAYEIAKLCSDSGIRVQNVLLIDALPPIAYTALQKGSAKPYETAFYYVAMEFLPVNDRKKFTYLKGEDTSKILQVIQEYGVFSNLDSDEIFEYYDKWVYCLELLSKNINRYKSLDNCILFRTTEEINLEILDALQIMSLPTREEWQLYFEKEIEIHEIDGNHYSIFVEKEKLHNLSNKFMEVLTREEEIKNGNNI